MNKTFINVKVIQGIGKTYLFIQQKLKNTIFLTKKGEITLTGREVVLLFIFSHMV